MPDSAGKILQTLEGINHSSNERNDAYKLSTRMHNLTLPRVLRFGTDMPQQQRQGQKQPTESSCWQHVWNCDCKYGGYCSTAGDAYLEAGYTL